MKSLLRFVIFVGFFVFCWIAFKQVEQRDSKELAVQLEVAQNKLAEAQQEKSELEQKLAEIQPSAEEIEFGEEPADAGN